jgi:hypothetical protein
MNDLFAAAGLWKGLVANRKRGLVFRQEVLDRVVQTHIIVALHKVGELLNHPIYASVFGSCALEWRKSVRRKIEAVSKLRNAYSGHIHDKRLNRPLYASELNDIYMRDLGLTVEDFLSWVIDSEDSVFHLLKCLRTFVESTYNIDPTEIMNR